MYLAFLLVFRSSFSYTTTKNPSDEDKSKVDDDVKEADRNRESLEKKKKYMKGKKGKSTGEIDGKLKPNEKKTSTKSESGRGRLMAGGGGGACCRQGDGVRSLLCGRQVRGERCESAASASETVENAEATERVKGELEIENESESERRRGRKEVQKSILE